MGPWCIDLVERAQHVECMSQGGPQGRWLSWSWLWNGIRWAKDERERFVNKLGREGDNENLALRQSSERARAKALAP